MLNDAEIRKFARIGALAEARRAVIEFPDILSELNSLADGRARMPLTVRLAGRVDDAPRRGRPPAALLERPDALRTERAARPRRLSAAGRLAISRAQKARWAAQKKAGR